MANHQRTDLLIYPQYDGVVAYNWTNGKVVWRYKYDAPYPYETVYGDDNTGEALYPFYDSIIRIADGKIYTSNTEHTASQPATRGWKLHCINATTGEGLWNITGSMAAGAVADGYLQANNRNDGFLYVFGKGKSATTVTAPQTAVSKGNAVLIEGTVLDQSPAQPGTPAVSKESIATQMEYLHMQKPIDGVEHNLTITGVPVTVDGYRLGRFSDLHRHCHDKRLLRHFQQRVDSASRRNIPNHRFLCRRRLIRQLISRNWSISRTSTSNDPTTRGTCNS